MDEREIKRTWRKLIIPFIIGVIALTTAILFHRLGSKRPGPQTLWFFVGVLGAVFTFFPSIKMIRFRQYLKSMTKNDGRNTEGNNDKTNTTSDI